MLEAHRRPTPGRIKYADPKSLPSYPSVGLRKDDSAAAAAASLGWAKQKPTEAKKPDPSKLLAISPSASAAALRAAGSKPAVIRRSAPSNSNSTGTNAALLAAESVVNRSSRSGSTQGNFGSSAANLAFKSPSHTAALGAVQSSRPRSHSSPTMGTSSSNPTVTLKKSMEEAGAVPTTTLPRRMFTSHPVIGPEAEDQKKADEIHSSAVAMARRMFVHHQDAAKDVHGETKQGTGALQTHPGNLQEAAFKLAQERLAKLDQENQKNKAFQDYYGASSDPMRRLSMRQKLRRRASSDSEVLDWKGWERLRRELSLFNRDSQVDDQKRQQDRNAVLVAAQRNVKAQLEGMDQNISARSGKMLSSKLTEWELKAHAAAQSKHDTRSMNKGKRDVGGGMYMAHSDIDAIATKRIQPVLNDINDKAQKERERLAALKAEEEIKRQEAEKQKAQDREVKENHRKLKEQQKNLERERRQKEKEEERQRKEDERAMKREEKAGKAEQRRLAKEEARRAKGLEAAKKKEGKEENWRGSNADSSSSEGDEDRDVRIPPENRLRLSLSESERSVQRCTSQEEPTSLRGERVKVWIKRKLSRRQKRPSADNNNETFKERRKSFLGVLSFSRVGRAGTESSTSLDSHSASMREVAMAGKERKVTSPPPSAARHEDSGFQDGGRASSPAKQDSVSSLSSNDSFAEASERLIPVITPPAPIRDPVAVKSASPTRDSRFKEMVD